MWRKCDNECIKPFSWQANSVILWIVINRWNCINYNFCECGITRDWESFRISTHKYMHTCICTCTITKLMSLFSLLFVLTFHTFNPYHYFHLSILRVRSFSHLTPRNSVTKSLNRGDNIVYTIYVTLLQLKLEIGNVQPIKKFFNRRHDTHSLANHFILLWLWYIAMMENNIISGLRWTEIYSPRIQINKSRRPLNLCAYVFNMCNVHFGP